MVYPSQGAAAGGGGGRSLGGKGLSEAKRNAEGLFESRTVAEIREVTSPRSCMRDPVGVLWGPAKAQLLACWGWSQIESRTRKDIEGKKQQLRQLVGDSYRLEGWEWGHSMQATPDLELYLASPNLALVQGPD